MEYDMEDLLPVLVKLTEKYTSNESSSVPYETAAMLMETIVYCTNECFANNSNKLIAEKKLRAEIAYERGYELVIEKVCQSKEIYDKLVVDFEDYGCNNYRDTIIKGMPAFFLKYDAKFQAQNHLLTLDYPSLKDYGNLQGVDIIYKYLSDIEMEQKFLKYFQWEVVQKLLESIMPDYKEDYVENICYPVLLNGIGCVIADKQVYLLRLNKEDLIAIENYFVLDNLEKIEYKVRSIIYLILSKTCEEMDGDYFAMLSKGYAIRIKNSLEHKSIEGLFCVDI